MIRPHEIDFKKFINRWTVEGSREYFEKFTLSYLKIKYKYRKTLIKKFRKNPGDWGIDVLCGELDNENFIWQCKFFPDKVGESQKAQIRRSYRRAIEKSREKHFRIVKWILCIPIDFGADEYQWWSKWKKEKQERDEISIGCIQLQDFQEDCKNAEFSSLFHYYFRDEFVESNPLINDLDIDSIEESSLFIRQVQNSDITTHLTHLKGNFFLADFIEKDIKLKDSDHEINHLDTIYNELYTIWEIFHSKIYSERDDDDGNDLFNEMRTTLVDKMEYFREFLPQLRISSIIGLVLKLSNRNIIYWTRDNYLVK